MHLKLFAFFCLILTVLGNYQQCNDLNTVEALHIVGHKDDEIRYRLQHNQNATINILFKSNIDSKTLTAKVTGRVSIVKTSFTKLEPDACQRGVACPIKKGETYNYTEAIYIGNYPRVPVTVEWKLVGDQEVVVVCVDIKIIVK